MVGSMTSRHGTAAWSSAEWLDEAVSWLDDQLAAAGIERTEDVEQPHLRPWATVLRAPTTSGVVWMKATGPGTAFEVGLYELLGRTVPDRVLTPIAADTGRGWIVLPDGGPPLADRVTETDLASALVAAIVQYGALQIDLAPHVDELLQLGVADMRPAVMMERFDQALEVTGAALRHGTDEQRVMHREVAAMSDTVASWCARLTDSQVPASLDHNDLHPWNILDDGSGGARFYDWGDSVVAHSFAAMLVPLGFAQRSLGDTDDPAFARARNAYLDVFSSVAPGEDLVATLDIACRVAKVARVLTWERAIQAARDQGEEIADDWAAAPVETLASLLDESYLGGA
jgi:hypothetical protein